MIDNFIIYDTLLIIMDTPAAHRLLNNFLKSRRARLAPKDPGLSVEPGRQRTKGLRRSEAAQLAGVSTAWYALLEMGQPRALTHKNVDGASQRNGELRLHPSIEFAVRHVNEVGIVIFDTWLTIVRANEAARIGMGNTCAPSRRPISRRLFVRNEQRRLSCRTASSPPSVLWADSAPNNCS